MGNWEKVGEHKSISSAVKGVLTFGAAGGGTTYSFKNTETGEIRTITAGGYLDGGYELTDEELGEKISNGEFDKV
jgi:hypothetical protein